MKLALAQMNSTADLEKNLATMETLTRQAAEGGAEIIVFPEMAYLSGNSATWRPVVPRFGELVDRFAEQARRYQIALMPGTLREPAPQPDRHFNTLLFLDAAGNTLGSYRKIFLFQANLPHKKYFEGKYTEAGCETKVVEWKGLRWGLSICYDLRFPELFRALRKKGADVFLLPAAFTVPTGEAHWETLVRARAIENQVYMVAPGLVGVNGENLPNYGHSLGVDPWGTVLADLEDREGLVIVDIQSERISEARAKVDAWACVRSDIFPLPIS